MYSSSPLVTASTLIFVTKTFMIGKVSNMVTSRAILSSFSLLPQQHGPITFSQSSRAAVCQGCAIPPLGVGRVVEANAA